MIRLVTLALLVLSTWSFVAPAPVHHFARTLAEVDYNEETHKLEIAMSIKPSDLEWVLTRRAGKPVDLEQTKNAEELVAEYLEEVFRVKNKSGKLRDHIWVGMEVAPQVVWVYFEVDLPDGLSGAKLTHRVLLDWERDQVNTVKLRVGERRETLTFDRRNATQKLG